MLRNLMNEHIQVDGNQIRNSIKRKIHGYIEYREAKKTGEDFIKD